MPKMHPLYQRPICPKCLNRPILKRGRTPQKQEVNVGTDTFQDTGTDAESVCLGMSSELEKLEIDYIVWFVQGYDTKPMDVDFCVFLHFITHLQT